jgi:hypothetical protein
MMLLILEAAARAFALALITGGSLWLLRVRNVAVQRTAWSIVLLSAFAMPALMRSPWIPSALQWRPEFLAAKVEAPGPSPIAYTPPAVTDLRLTSVHRIDAPPIRAPRPVPSQWRFTPATFFAIYCAISGLLFLRLMVGLVSAIALWRRATPEPALSTSDLRVRVSPEVSSPVTIGSGVVLPADYDHWSPEKLRAVLAHERSHVCHFDFHLQLLAGVYAALVWFSPLGWWLRRRLAVLGEVVSDQAGIAEAGTRSNYAEIVLHFAAMPRRPITGVAMASSGNITRRIEHLLNEDLYQAAFQRGRKRAIVVFLLVAFAIFATSLVLRVPAAHAAQVAPAPPAAAPEAPAAAPEAPASGSDVSAPEPPLQTPDRPEAPPSSNVERTTTATHSERGNSYSYGYSDDGESYALVDGSGTNMSLSGNWSSDNPKREIENARRVANGNHFFWFRHDGKSYVVTDPQVLAEVKALYAPMEELGRQQEELGKQQEALGRQQEAIGHKQEMASVSTPDLTREINELNATMKKLQSMQGKDTTQEQLADVQEKLGDLQGRIGDLQGKIGEKQGSFGEEQGRLGEQQGKLGEQQGRLGEQQAKLAQQADKKVKVVINETLSNGKAKPVQ